MGTLEDVKYGFVAAVDLPFDEALERLEASLNREGFGTLCRIDVQAKLQEKLGVEFPRYIILGVCSPPVAYQALRQEVNLGLLLPCNAVVYERDGKVYAGTVDAGAMLSVTGNTALEGLATEVNERLRRAVEGLFSRPAGD